MLRLLFISILLFLSSCSNISQESIRKPSGRNHNYVDIDSCFVSVNHYLQIKGINWEVHRQTKISPFELELDEIKFYEGHRNILRLSDGEAGYQKSIQIAASYPNSTILSADYNFKGLNPHPDFPNVAKLHLDNTKVLPIPSHSQDMIVMKRGLCACHDSCKTCGGLDLSKSYQLKAFFNEIIRVMKVNNPNARAILQGGVFRDYDLGLSAYVDVLTHFKNHPKVELLYLKRKSIGDDRFFGIMIRPRNWQEGQ